MLLDIFVKRPEYQDAVYCIDEPEAHVNTALHGRLLKAMLRLVPDESQLWLATHSIGFVRQAYELMKLEGNVVFLDFGNCDFDQPAVIRPHVPNRVFFQNAYNVALDDLSNLIAPENIVVCEGKKSEADKGFDAACYNRLFSDIHPETLFISYGSSTEVKNSQNLMRVLEAVTKGTSVWSVIDRDDMTGDERTQSIEAGVRVLRRRELENYLYDPDVLRTFLVQNGQESLIDTVLNRRQELLDDSQMPDDIKNTTQQLLVHIRSVTQITNLGNRREGFALSHLVPALRATPDVFQELLEDVFPQESDEAS